MKQKYIEKINEIADDIRSIADGVEDTKALNDLYEVVGSILDRMDDLRYEQSELSELATTILEENLRGEVLD